MTHSRVTPQGKEMGENAVRLAELGLARLTAMGLENVKAPKLREDMCKTCACQPGSVPNGCLQTQLDFIKAVAEGTPFLCHSPQDGRMCAGWVHVRAQLVAEPLPPGVMALLAQMDFSPAEETGTTKETA